MSNDGNDDDVCIACNIALKNGDKFYSDVDGGYLHAACAGPEREGYVGADGEPLKDGDPIPEPKTWVDPPPGIMADIERVMAERRAQMRTDAESERHQYLLAPLCSPAELLDLLNEIERRPLSSPRVEEVRREERARIEKALERANTRLPGIEVPAANGDNLAVVLCSHFCDGEPSEDDRGWSPAAIEGEEQMIEAIRKHYLDALSPPPGE